MHLNQFQQGDRCVYRGEKFRSLRNKIGTIVAAVVNQQGVYSVEFPDEEDPHYVIAEQFLSPAAAARPEERERETNVEVQRRRKRVSEDD